MQACYKFTFTYLRETCKVILEGTHQKHVVWKDALLYECLEFTLYFKCTKFIKTTRWEIVKKIKCLKQGLSQILSTSMVLISATTTFGEFCDY